MQKNFNNQKSKLTEQDIDTIVSIIGHRCRAKTVNRLRSIITYSPSMIPAYGILNRLILDDHGWSYCAGQDYTSELKTVRDCILNG